MCHWQALKQGADNMGSLVNSQNIAEVVSNEFRLADFENGKGSEVNIFWNRQRDGHKKIWRYFLSQGITTNSEYLSKEFGKYD